MEYKCHRFNLLLIVKIINKYFDLQRDYWN